MVVRKRQSRPWLVSDELWSGIEPLSPEPGPGQGEGPPRAPDRGALYGILFVLHAGIQWQCLPQKLGFAPGKSCWWGLAAWTEDRCLGPVARGTAEDAAVEEQAGLVKDSDRLLPPPGCTQGPETVPARSAVHV
ncbi:transposase [Streptomyces sp. WG7]|uniref:transposase n=1 Tax=Streptomyces sp. WG7 TaxID=3417650 RepID=UPI003CF1E7A7